MHEVVKWMQMRHMWSFKAYEHHFNAEMQPPPKMDECAKNCIVVGRIANMGGGCFFQVPKVSWGRGRDHQDWKSIETSGPPPKKLSGTSQRSSSSRNMSQGKERKKFGPLYQYKKWAESITPNKDGIQGGKPFNIWNKESGFVVPRKIIFVM